MLQQACAESGGELLPLVVRRLRPDDATEQIELKVTLPALPEDDLAQVVEGAKDPAELVRRREAFVRQHLGAHYQLSIHKQN